MDALIHFPPPVNEASGFRALILELGVQQGQNLVLLFILRWMDESEKHHHGSPLRTGSGIKGPALGEEPSSPARGPSLISEKPVASGHSFSQACVK